MVSWTRTTRLVAVLTLRLQSDPDLAVLEMLLLPDRHRLLERVDGEAARLEGLRAMGRGHRDHHARLADLQPADAVDEGDSRDRGPAAADGRADLAHLGQRHGAMGLVLEELHPASPGLVPHHAREQGERARPRVLHRAGDLALRQ